MSTYKQVFDIPALVEAIREFSDQGRPEHKRYMREIRYDLLIDPSFKDLLPEFYQVRYETWMEQDETRHLVEYLQTYDEDQLRLFSLEMKRCRCCSRHSHYKNVPFKPTDSLPESRGYGCSCSCRKMYRVFKAYGLA